MSRSNPTDFLHSAKREHAGGIAARVRAPRLVGAGGWINTGGRALTLTELRGKIVLLDFWTFCCINCLHIIDELRPLEAKYAHTDDAALVVIGVHSPKFEHETDHNAVVAAVERYGITHPVLDDPQLTTWDAYTARAWPTLVVVDPEGYVVAHMSGEGHAHSLDVLIGELIATHEARGTLRRGNSPFVPPPLPATTLRFPGKALLLPDAAMLASDSGNHSLVVLEDDLVTVRTRIGSVERGLRDGDAAIARFSEPQGLCLLPPDVAARVGYDVVVADTVNHALRGVHVATLHTATIAGTGTQRMTPLAPGRTPARETELSSPWDVVWHSRLARVLIAMAGTHQLATFDPIEATVEWFAGTGHEGLTDGPLTQAWFAQPSGLAVDGDIVWVADSETSALRFIAGEKVHTAIGRGLFTFGHKDGPAADALLQHPLGVRALPDGSVAIADTYNGAIRRYDPRSKTVTTLAADLAEPSDVVVMGEHLVVIESSAHQLTALPLAAKYLDVETREYTTERRPTALAPGAVDLTIAFTPPTGQHFDDRDGPATRVVVDATPTELLLEGSGATSALSRRLILRDLDHGVLHVSATVATCDDAGEHAACHLHQQDWGIPVLISSSGGTSLDLMLAART